MKTKHTIGLICLGGILGGIALGSHVMKKREEKARRMRRFWTAFRLAEESIKNYRDDVKKYNYSLEHGSTALIRNQKLSPREAFESLSILTSRANSVRELFTDDELEELITKSINEVNKVITKS